MPSSPHEACGPCESIASPIASLIAGTVGISIISELIRFQVYKARLDGMSDVAIKIMQPESAHQLDHKRKFYKEIEILRACRDRHVVGFVGAFVDEVSSWLSTSSQTCRISPPLLLHV